MQRSFWQQAKGRCGAHLRARLAIAGPRARSLQPVSHQTLPYRSRRDWHVLACKSYETEENVTPDFEFCDFASTTVARHERNWHINHAYGLEVPPPKDAVGIKYENYVPPLSDPGAAGAPRILRAKTKFCAFVNKNPFCATRNRFLDILAQHHRVDSAGKLWPTSPKCRAPIFARLDFICPTNLCWRLKTR